MHNYIAHSPLGVALLFSIVFNHNSLKFLGNTRRYFTPQSFAQLLMLNRLPETILLVTQIRAPAGHFAGRIDAHLTV